jgi:hypothetical protein
MRVPKFLFLHVMELGHYEGVRSLLNHIWIIYWTEGVGCEHTKAGGSAQNILYALAWHLSGSSAPEESKSS